MTASRLAGLRGQNGSTGNDVAVAGCRQRREAEIQHRGEFAEIVCRGREGLANAAGFSSQIRLKAEAKNRRKRFRYSTTAP